ncbi:MFS transporter, partial [Pseudomonas aeruginosa]|uniref:MFS transporter n=3 Tax=Pseudomonas aeruginosa group TaxID=136841 RepID=UPI001BAF5307
HQSSGWPWPHQFLLLRPSKNGGITGSIVGLWCVGAWVDRQLQRLAVASITVFAFATLLLGLWGYSPQMVYLSVMTWGFAFGGFATITQTALSRFAGDSVDVAQSVYTTGWNTAVASGGVVGGLLLERTGVASFAWIVIGILAISLLGTVFAMNKVLKGNR